MSKYAKLTRCLGEKRDREWSPSFREIEEILGFALPPAARRHRAWWSNNDSNNVMTRAWLDAGWRTEQVDMNRETLVFRRATKETNTPTTPPPAEQSPAPQRRSVIGVLKGTVVFLGDADGPTGEVWNAEEGRL